MVLPPGVQLESKCGALWCSDDYRWCCSLAIISKLGALVGHLEAVRGAGCNIW